MANYYSQLCCALPFASGPEMLAAHDGLERYIRANTNADEEFEYDGCSYYGVLDTHMVVDDNLIIVTDEAGESSVDSVVPIMLFLLRQPGCLRDSIIVSYANTCSSNRIDAFSGGAVLIAVNGPEQIVKWISSSDVEDQLMDTEEKWRAHVLAPDEG